MTILLTARACAIYLPFFFPGRVLSFTVVLGWRATVAGFTNRPVIALRPRFPDAMLVTSSHNRRTAPILEHYRPRCEASIHICNTGEMATISADRLYEFLSAARLERGISWRTLAKQIGVSASLLSRISNGQKPDADGFATIVRWLGVPAEEFIDDVNETRAAPDVLVQLAPLLRAQKDLDEVDVKYLEQVIAATLERARSKGS